MFIAILSLIASLHSAHALDISGDDIITGAPATVSLDGTSVVVFLSSKCPCSESHEAVLKQLSQKYNHVKFVGIHSNADEPLAEARAHFKKSALPFPVLQDDKGGALERFKAFKTPHVFLLADNGKVVFQGGVTDSHDAKNAKKNFLADALEDVHQKRTVRVAEARTLGCIIARGKGQK
jgi:thiol-disulfide isomerase/thioredoxin